MESKLLFGKISLQLIFYEIVNQIKVYGKEIILLITSSLAMANIGLNEL